MNLSIKWPGPSALAASGDNARRIITIASGTTAAISGLTIENGTTSGTSSRTAGRGINNNGTLDVSNRTPVDNSFPFFGGRVFSQDGSTFAS